MRRRKKDRHLPACMYQKHGAYYLVRQNRWIRLGTTLQEALQRYSRLVSADRGDVVGLIDRTIEDARKRVKASTLQQYELAGRRLKEALVEFAIDEVEPRHVGQLMDHYRDKPNFANRMRTLLRQAFATAVRTGLRESNPVTEIPPFRERKRTRYLTDDEWHAIRQAGSPTLQCIMDVAYYTAQRISDVLAIRLADISDEGIQVQQQKTGRRLLVAMTPELREAVERSKRLHRTTKFYLLAQRNGRIRSYYGVRGLLRRAADRAGIEDVGWHDIRAKSITDAKRQGLDAQQLAGHTTEAQTLRYLRGRETTVVTGPSFRQSNK